MFITLTRFPYLQDVSLLPNGWTPPPTSLQEGATNFYPHEPPKEVKTELKKAIQDKRLSKGEDIPTVEWREPPPPQVKSYSVS
jgi:hypothetical protein